MKNMHIKHRALIGVAMAAILYVFFHQANVALDSYRVSFDDTPIAYGYSSVAFSGTVYVDEGVTNVGLGSGVGLSINGGSADTTTTNASGEYSFTGLEINQDDIITVFINNEVRDGVLVVKLDDSELSDQSVTGMDIYADRLILRSDLSDRNITTTNLDLANNASDSDIDDLYSLSSSNLILDKDSELYIWEGTTHTTSGNILTHDLDVRGTLTMASNADITASGSFVIAGDITTTGDIVLRSTSSGELLQASNTSLNHLYVDYGLEAYFRFDEGSGVNATGATLVPGTGGTLFGGALWTESNTGTTLFYNRYAIELDGANDRIGFGNIYPLDTSTTIRTYATWFRRKGSDSDDVIFSKKTGSGASAAGYMLWIDDDTDKLFFELADGGSNTYLVESVSSVTDQDWHHVAVSYNPNNIQDINIFLDGSIDVASKSGGLESGGQLSGNITNSESFQIGRAGSSSGTFIGTIDDFRMYNRVMSGDELSVLAAGFKSTGSGTYYLKDDIDINGDFCLYAGTVDVGTGYSINVAGDYCAYAGELRTNSGTFVLDGSNQTIRGSTAFNQISKTNTSSVTLTFEMNTEQTVSGAITIQGALSNQMTLVTTSSGSQAFLIVENSGATILEYLDVQDNNAFSGALLSCTEGCIDSNNNVNWEFVAECGDGIVGGSEQCDDGNSNNLDTCPNDCQFPVCGDNILEGLEECEPPNSGTCLSNCLTRGSGGGGTTINNSSAASFFNRPDPPDGCGNGIFEPDLGEECDAGTRFNGLGTCSFDCKKLVCGDGIVSPQIGEDCEPTVKSESDDVKIFEVATCGETCTAPEQTAQGTYYGGCKRLFLTACGSATSSAPAVRPSAPSQCGNGVVDSGEECDFGGICDGGSFDGSFWTDAASAQTCTTGGGTPQPSSGDGCSDTCQTEFCGDGFIQQRGADNQPGNADDEECDNGSICSNDPTKSCRLNSDCGSEGTCDYHAALSAACSSECKNIATPAEPQPQPSQPEPECGNGAVEGTEECDDGNANGSDSSSCTEICTLKQVAETPAPSQSQPRCGDGIIQDDEQCDNGDANSDISPDGCRTNCRLAFCGDFVLDANEQCDNGDGNSDFFSDSCRTDCSLPRCGDGTVDSGEECDGGLACTVSCQFVGEAGRCGNGIVEEGEQCDDGNTDDGDTCSSTCRTTEPVRAAAPELVIDADVVVVNPEEYANGLKFIDGNDPCSILTVKGMNQKALAIRAAANRQGIPIVRNVALARSLYSTINRGEKVFGTLCTAINELKPSKPAPPEQPLPQQPTIFSYGFYNYAQLQPLVTANPPAGDTGPGTIAIVVSGAAGGLGWMRRRRK